MTHGTSTKYSSLQLFGDQKLSADGVTFQVGANSADDNTIQADADLFKEISFKSLTTYTKTEGDETTEYKVTKNEDFSLVKMYNTKKDADGKVEQFEPTEEEDDKPKNSQDAFALAPVDVGWGLNSQLRYRQTRENLACKRYFLSP